MVRRRALLSGVCTGAVLSALTPRLQASIRMAGRIIALRGDGSADVKRRSGDQLPARAGLLLYGGDSIVVGGEIEVIASVYGVIRTYKATDTDTLVAERPISSIEPEDEQYFARFESFAAENPAAMPSYRVAREATKTDYSIKPSPLVPPGPQLLLDSLKTAAFVWQGGSGRVRVTPDFGDPVEISSGTSAWLVLKIPPGADRLRIQLLDQPIQWTLNVASKASIEKKASGRALKQGHAARLRWAHETLLAPPPRFDDLRLTALSIVAEEAQGQDVTSEFARVAWLAARNGRLERQLACTGTASATAC